MIQRNKYAELNLPILEASLRGITANFPSDRPALLRILEASFGELNPREMKNQQILI